MAITKTGNELVKEAAVYEPTLRAFVAGSEALADYAKRSAKSENFQKYYRQSPKAYSLFMSSALKELEPLQGKLSHRFYMGDIGGREVYGNIDRLKEFPGKRLAQTVDHAGGVFSDLSPEEVHELFMMGFQSDPAKILKGVSYGSKEYAALRSELESILRGKFKDEFRGVSDEQLAKYLSNKWNGIKRTGTDPNCNKHCQYIIAGVNDIYTSTSEIVTKSGHRPILLTKPTGNFHELGDADDFTTLYKAYPEKLKQDSATGRIVEPLLTLNKIQ